MTAPNLDDYRWLTSPAASERVSWASTATDSLPNLAQKLRRDLSSAQARLVLEQRELRIRARDKFSRAEQMFFTAMGLQQATDEVVAAHKAARFASAATVLDLCSGIGGDLMALAGRGPADGCDRDPILALLAQVNATAALGPQAPTPLVHVCDVEDLDVADYDAWHMDPDRRDRGRRTTQIAFHAPGPAVIERLLARNAKGAIKLAPATELPESWHVQAESEWISRAGECRQLVAWFGALARDEGKRRATVLSRTGAQARTVLESPDAQPPPVAAIGQYLFEPDAAVLAAGIEATLAAEHQLAAIAPGSVYWTGGQALSDLALQCFEVCEVLAFRLKPLKSLLARHDVGQLEIKKRGVEVDPPALRRQLALRGSLAATLLVTRIEKRAIAILARRVGRG